VTNSVRHAARAVPGGIVTVTVAAGDEVVRVEVTDLIGDGVPVLPSAAESAEGSRVLWLADALSLI
jgi:anti-sigma regulatory factor (Ser/Thr protein kinase)